MNQPRVALFACSYHEVDGVANTVRNFEKYAAERRLPFLLVNGGCENRIFFNQTVKRLEFCRKFPKFPIDKKHDFDLLFCRNYSKVKTALEEYQPDLIHVTGPSDVGMMGALLAHRLNLPLVASWHTNVHEYAEQRAAPLLRLLPDRLNKIAGKFIRNASLMALTRFYRIPRLLFAPNPELMESLQKLTGKECRLMWRGVDVDLFRPKGDFRFKTPFTIGYIGRLTAEKNIRMLVDLERELLSAGTKAFRFLIVGQGASEPWLRENMICADFAGVLHGERLAEAYAKMDVFVFPSRTETFGNVVLEALASGVPAIVSDSGGPKFIVRHGETGFVAPQFLDYFRFIIDLMSDPLKRQSMKLAARGYALKQSWNEVFDSVYSNYSKMLATESKPAGNLQAVRPILESCGAAAKQSFSR